MTALSEPRSVLDAGATRLALAGQQREFAILARAVDVEATVPGCPGWRALDVVTHLTGVHRWAAAMSRTAPGSPVPSDADPGPALDPCAEYAAAAAELLVALDEDPARACLTLRGVGVAADWNRRQLHETLVHTWDLADAAGLPRWGPADVVADAVAEVLDTMTPRQVRLGRMPAPTVAVELLGSRRWVLGSGPVVASVAGPDAELLRVLWRRTGWDCTTEGAALVVQGDLPRARALLALPLTP